MLLFVVVQGIEGSWRSKEKNGNQRKSGQVIKLQYCAVSIFFYEFLKQYIFLLHREAGTIQGEGGMRWQVIKEKDNPLFWINTMSSYPLLLNINLLSWFWKDATPMSNLRISVIDIIWWSSYWQMPFNTISFHVRLAEWYSRASERWRPSTCTKPTTVILLSS